MSASEARPMRSVFAYIGVGSNLGDRFANLRRAAELLDSRASVRVRRRSSIYETEPLGELSQPTFLNAVLEVETQLPPRGLLHRCLEIETELGRVRSGVRNEARRIDLDVLLYGDEVIAERNLVIPHGELHNRAFALAPLVEIDSNIEHPALGRRVVTLLRRLSARGVVRLETPW